MNVYTQTAGRNKDNQGSRLYFTIDTTQQGLETPNIVYKFVLFVLRLYVLIGDEVILPADQDCYAVRVIEDSGAVAEMIFCDVDTSTRDHSHILVPSTDVLQPHRPLSSCTTTCTILLF